MNATKAASPGGCIPARLPGTRSTSGHSARAFKARESTDAGRGKNSCMRVAARVSSPDKGLPSCFWSRVLAEPRPHNGWKENGFGSETDLCCCPAPATSDGLPPPGPHCLQFPSSEAEPLGRPLLHTHQRSETLLALWRS